ncbi:MAG: NUDIX domain-containing protein [Xanthobacteraceae bacterium]|jgi:8-oxo-dGTP diphosphatase
MHREYACAILVDVFGRLLLQQRDDIPGILQPGKIALFGGHREHDETYLQCVVREVYEETSYFLPPERFEPLASHDGRDVDVEGGTAHGEFFVARDVPREKLVITEGTLLVATPAQVASLESRLSPSGKVGIKALLESGRLLAD